MNFEMFQGDDHVLEVSVQDSNGDPIDLSGSLIDWALAANVSSDQLLIQKNSGASPGGITITDAGGGVFEVLIDAEDTEDLSGLYYHQSQVIDAEGSVSTIVAGWVRIKATL
jgi:hypothetical protein